MQCVKGTRFWIARFSCFPNIDAVSLLKQVKFTENFPTARASTLACTWSKVNQSLIQTLSRMESKGIGMHTLNHMCRKGKHVRNNTQIIYNVWKNGKEWSIKNCIPWIGDATTWNEQLHHHCLEQLRDVLKEPLWCLWPSRVLAVRKSMCFLY
jgi:hypothetical protein